MCICTLRPPPLTFYLHVCGSLYTFTYSEFTIRVCFDELGLRRDHPWQGSPPETTVAIPHWHTVALEVAGT